MINLLKSPIGEPELVSLLSIEPLAPLLHAAGSKEWERISANPLAQNLLAPIREQAISEADEPLPVLGEEMYADFSKTGRRLPFETLYFERRRRFARAAICLLLDSPDERYRWLSSFLAKLSDIVAEVSWSLPAHVSNPTGIDPLRIDLFAAETANLMGEILTVFGEFVPSYLAAKIVERLKRDFFQNFIDNNASHGWPKSTNNWNAVCHQGVIGAALAIERDPEILARMLWLTRENLPLFLSGYGEDGGCAEGPGYWGYGFGWFAVLNEQLEAATDGKISLVENDPQIVEIARYAPRVSLSNDYVVNFSDSGNHNPFRPSVLSYLGNRLNDSQLRSEALYAWKKLVDGGFALDIERFDFFYLVRAFRDLPDSLPDTQVVSLSDHYFPDLEVLVARRLDGSGVLWELAAKGGNNDEPHNHNDLGNYILNVGGNPIVTEIGAPEYDKAFFSEARYRNLAARSLGHSVPLINGFEQSAGRGFCSTVLEHSFSSDSVRFVVDLTRAYPEAAGVVKLIRTIAWENQGVVTVTDNYALSYGGEIETAVVTSETVDFVGMGAGIQSGKFQMRVLPSKGSAQSQIQVHKYSDHGGKLAQIHRIVVKPQELSLAGGVGYSLVIIRCH